MLGLLFSKEEHPEGINCNVGAVLPGLTSKKASVQHEARNALMDIYGDEEKHPSVFKDLNVVGHFERTLSGFKRSIQADRADASREEVEQWKETALNLIALHSVLQVTPVSSASQCSTRERASFYGEEGIMSSGGDTR